MDPHSMTIFAQPERRSMKKGQLYENTKAGDVTDRGHEAWLSEGKMNDQAMLLEQMLFNESKLNRVVELFDMVY